MSTALTPLAAARAAAAAAPDPAPGSWAAHLHTALAEVDRLAELLAVYRTPPPAGPSAPPKPDPTYARREQMRAEAETGYTTYAPFVGRVLCPAREKCTAGLLTVFQPLKNGRLPMHRHETLGYACPGAHQKPVTPPLKLRTDAPTAERRERAATVDRLTGGQR
ncbi:hypothetical protein [Streptomyces triculaminicus]|uniref:hypothetical protein n=1 Tax=Streptomyces triculaminicus TaxID=2816232 RepID=UPI0037D6CB34